MSARFLRQCNPAVTRPTIFSKRFQPTAAQRKILEAMTGGARAEFWPGMNAKAYLRGNGTYDTLNISTFCAIRSAGWITRQEATEGASLSQHYVITPAGRAALAHLPPAAGAA